MSEYTIYIALLVTAILASVMIYSFNSNVALKLTEWSNGIVAYITAHWIAGTEREFAVIPSSFDLEFYDLWIYEEKVVLYDIDDEEFILPSENVDKDVFAQYVKNNLFVVPGKGCGGVFTLPYNALVDAANLFPRLQQHIFSRSGTEKYYKFGYYMLPVDIDTGSEKHLGILAVFVSPKPNPQDVTEARLQFLPDFMHYLPFIGIPEQIINASIVTPFENMSIYFGKLCRGEING